MVLVVYRQYSMLYDVTWITLAAPSVMARGHV